MDALYSSEFQTQIVEQIYCSSAKKLQIAQGNDGMVGWFASQFRALHSNTHLCKTITGFFVHALLYFEWYLSERGWDGIMVGSGHQLYDHDVQQ